MPGAGDYVHYRQMYADKCADADLLAADTAKTLVVPKTAKYVLYIQKITYTPGTAAAQAITFRDTTGTPIVLAVVPASQTLPWQADYGPKGKPLAAGKSLVSANTAGPAGSIHVEAYERMEGVTYDNAGASSQ